MLLPICGWTARNIAAIGGPVPLSTSGGLNLLIGNNDSATGSSGVDVSIEGIRAQTARMGEVEADRFYRDAAFSWITDHPAKSFTLYLAKVINYFSPYNQPITLAEGASLQRFVAVVSFGTVILLVAIRALLRHRLPLQPAERLFISLFFVNSLVMAIFFTRTRFRQPLDSILLVEAAIACVLVGAALGTRLRGHPTAASRLFGRCSGRREARGVSCSGGELSLDSTDRSQGSSQPPG